MLSSISRAAIKRVVGLHPSSTRFLASTSQLQRVEAHQNATFISPSSLLSFLARRSYATATKSAPAKKPAATKAATKKPAAKKTATTKSAAKKPAKKPAKKAVKKPVKKAKAKPKPKPKPKPKARTKKPVKESVLAFRKRKQLREAALLAEEPEAKPITARAVFMTSNLKGQSGKDKFLKANAELKALSASEIERLNHTANENKAANEVALKKWLATHTPNEIRLANNARAALRKMTGKQVPRALSDERIPSHPMGAWPIFVKDRFASGDFAGIAGVEALKLISTEYKALPPAQRKVYEDKAAADTTRYWNEVKTVFNREPEKASRA
ncbi:hypothetical protein ACMFMG_003046 [Clarireedia jacksonii]